MRQGIGTIRLAGLLVCMGTVACGRPVDVQFQVPPTPTLGAAAQVDAGSTRRVTGQRRDAGTTPSRGAVVRVREPEVAPGVQAGAPSQAQVPQLALEVRPARDDGTLYDAAGRPVRTDVPLFNAAGQRVDPTGRVLTGPMSLGPAPADAGGVQATGPAAQPDPGTAPPVAKAEPPEPPAPEPEVADEATDQTPPVPPPQPTYVPILYLWPIFLDPRFVGQGQSGFGDGASGSTTGYPTPGNPFAPVGVATPSNPLPGFAP
jgi:hypothetical protein